jgi:hypothetical protein
MECKEFEHLIPDFLQKNMGYGVMEDFREHMDHCEACKEELSIQFLVAEGMRHLEDDGAFDLQKELDRRLEENRNRLMIHKKLLLARRHFFTALITAVCMVILLFLG